MDKKGFDCNVCRKKFVNRSNLVRHIRSIHKLNLKRNEKKILCAVCKTRFNFYKALEEHLHERHNFTPKILRRVFSSIEAFQAYKRNIEEAQSSFFTTARRVGFKTYYSCHLSGNSKSLKKETNSGKLNGTCPARIVAYIRGNVVGSFAQLQHFGHSCSVKFLRLRKEERAAIAAQIDKGKSFDGILNDLRSSMNKNTVKRINLIKKKDLHNIAREFNLCPDNRYLSDAGSLDKWVSMANLNENNPVLFYKKQGEASGSLEKQDFMVVLSTLYLKSTPLSSVKKILCDSTLENKNDFQLTALLILNEEETALPLAYCISNKVDTKTMIAFFQVIKKNYGEFSGAFMADDAKACYDAWCQVMNIPNQRLFCPWHIFKKWKTQLKTESSIQSLDKKQKILALCREVLDTSKTSEFFSFLNKLLIYCKTYDETRIFGEYFVQQYASKLEHWAYSFWKERGFNTNLYLKSWHRLFKYCYIGTKCRRIDKCLNLLMGITETIYKWTVFGIRKTTLRLHEILEYHKQSLQIPLSFIKKVKNNKWIVKGQSSDRPKIVQKGEEVCTCNLKCPHCCVCVHQVSCTCLNFLIYGIICKHIHACLTVPYPWELTPNGEVLTHPQELSDETIEFLEDENIFDTNSLESRRRVVVKDLQLICDLIDVIPEDIVNELHTFTSILLHKVVDLQPFS